MLFCFKLQIYGRNIFLIVKFLLDSSINYQLMGCGESHLKDKPLQDESEETVHRRNKKYRKLKVSNNDVDSSENVQIDPQGQITKEDFKIIEKAFSKHYLFYKLKENQRSQLIYSMKSYMAHENQIIFQRGDPASLFFVIKSGKVLVDVNGQNYFLEKGSFFGELALLYKAPRSATIRTLQPCSFLCLSHEIFKTTIQEMIKKNFAEAKTQIEKTSLFKYLTKKQKNMLTYSANILKYQVNDIIFNEGDDANSFFIVMSGKIQIEVPGKTKLQLQKGDTFGENSFQSNKSRKGTARAVEKVQLLAVGGTSMKKYLGSQLKELSFHNIIKWALQRHNLFSWMSQSEIEKVITLVKIQMRKDQDSLCQIGDIATTIFICLQEKINQGEVGQLFNCEYLLCKDQQTDLRITIPLKKNGPGHVGFLPIQSIYKLMGKQMDLFVKKPVPKSQLAMYEDLRNQYLKNLQLGDFLIKAKLGQGQFGKVFLVEDKFKKIFALKCIYKKNVIANQLESYIISEKATLQQINHPFINKLYTTFHDANFVYFLLKYVDGGDFFHMLRSLGHCAKDKARFYFGCFVLAIQNLHAHNIVYRDIKPENAVLDKKGYLTLIDLGTAKILSEENGYRTFTIVGTPHYMAPEVSDGQGYTFSTDIWSLGIILFEMVCGCLPFGDNLDDPYEVLNAINEASEPKFPQNYTDQTSIHLITMLLQKDPVERHIENFVRIKNSSFFDEFRWENLEKRTMVSPIKANNENQKEAINVNFKVYMKEEMEDVGEGLESKNARWNDLFT